MHKLIKNGLIFDAIHKEPYTADILVADGKIAAVGENLCAEGAEVIDAAGKHVYPGFVDAHSHLGMIGSGIGFEGSSRQINHAKACPYPLQTYLHSRRKLSNI